MKKKLDEMQYNKMCIEDIDSSFRLFFIVLFPAIMNLITYAWVHQLCFYHLLSSSSSRHSISYHNMFLLYRSVCLSDLSWLFFVHSFKLNTSKWVPSFVCDIYKACLCWNHVLCLLRLLLKSQATNKPTN